jgi:hypothetical protein
MKVHDLDAARSILPPKAGDLYLIRVPGVARGEPARQAMREALRTLLAVWRLGTVRMAETPSGPNLEGSPFKVSFSYDGEDGWMAIGAFARIGCDAVAVAEFPEMGAVARRYLGPEVAARIVGSRVPAQTFAHAWAKHEATLKAHGLPLSEGSAGISAPTCHYHRQSHAVVAVVAE